MKKIFFIIFIFTFACQPVEKFNYVVFDNNQFSKYDILIGSGLTPAILNRVNINLDLFFPYSFGVEWVGNPIFNKK